MAAIATSLIGFMEAFSIAEAMAARTRQRLDATGEEVLHRLIKRWRASRIEPLLARKKKQFKETVWPTGVRNGRADGGLYFWKCPRPCER